MDRLSEDRARIIANAIESDGFAVGSVPWLEEHHVEADEFASFLEYPVRLAQMYDWKERNLGVGGVGVQLTFVKHTGKVGSGEETWTVHAPVSDTTKILMVAEHGVVDAQLFPTQLPLDIDGCVTVDVATGEVV